MARRCPSTRCARVFRSVATLCCRLFAIYRMSSSFVAFVVAHAHVHLLHTGVCGRGNSSFTSVGGLGIVQPAVAGYTPPLAIRCNSCTDTSAMAAAAAAAEATVFPAAAADVMQHANAQMPAGPTAPPALQLQSSPRPRRPRWRCRPGDGEASALWHLGSGVRCSGT